MLAGRVPLMFLMRAVTLHHLSLSPSDYRTIERSQLIVSFSLPHSLRLRPDSRGFGTKRVQGTSPQASPLVHSSRSIAIRESDFSPISSDRLALDFGKSPRNCPKYGNAISRRVLDEGFDRLPASGTKLGAMRLTRTPRVD